MRIRQIVVDMGQNCYLYYSENRECLIIDPGSRSSEIVNVIKELQLNPLAILLTHGHFDHIGAIDDLRKSFDIECYIHQNERYFLIDGEMNGSSFFGIPPIVMKEAEKLITSEKVLKIGPFEIKPIHTPGHTSGGVCYYDKNTNIIFTGDTLFQSGIGRTDLYSGDQKQLISSIREKLMTLPDETVVLAGHGASSTVKTERALNPFI